jgi:hypothetical protein
MPDNRNPTWYVLGLTAILVVIGWVGLTFPDRRATVWLVVLVLLAAFAVLAGHGITGSWRGILIDARNKMSLSRLQFVAWTLVVLSAILTAALTNLATEWLTPLDFTVPSQLWVLMGISTASLVGSPAILSNKRDRKTKADSREALLGALKEGGYDAIDEEDPGLIVRNTTPGKARWADLLKGEELGNAAHVDLGKMQMFFFTFVLVVSYAAAISAMFSDVEGTITELPQIQDGMNVLLGISHTGYLSSKAISHTPEEPVVQPS